jgi:hypothetical protein
MAAGHAKRMRKGGKEATGATKEPTGATKAPTGTPNH